MAAGEIVVDGIYFLEPCRSHDGLHAEWELGRFVQVKGRVEIGASASRAWRIYFPRRPSSVTRAMCTAGACCLREPEEGEVVVCLLAE